MFACSIFGQFEIISTAKVSVRNPTASLLIIPPHLQETLLRTVNPSVGFILTLNSTGPCTRSGPSEERPHNCAHFVGRLALDLSQVLTHNEQDIPRPA
jgi:hypothetical protein